MKGCIFLVAVVVQQATLLLAAPSIESCPHDSILVEDICKCNPDSCQKPACMTDLQIAVNSSNIPGECCPKYSCEGCSNTTMIDGKCPCAPDAILNDQGECTCVDPNKSLISNECTCDVDKCPLAELCDTHSVAVQETNGCCTTTKCIKCPDDSYSTNNFDPNIEDKCVCYPCSIKCKYTEKVVIMQRGSGFPGNCCDVYRCEEKKFCTFNSKVYNVGTNWTAPNGQLCECKDGIAFCVEIGKGDKFCYEEGNVYQPNESWMVDSCTNCSCVNGAVKCIAHMCDVRENKKVNCPPIKCNKACPHGFKTSKLGCPTCKCNTTTVQYSDILNKYNITEEQLEVILKEHFNGGAVETSTIQASIPVTNSTMHPPNGQESQYTEIVIPLATVIILISVVAIVGCLCHKRRGKKGSYDTCPPSEPPTTSEERVWNNNNNNMENAKENNQSIRGYYRRKLGEILWRQCTP